MWKRGCERAGGRVRVRRVGMENRHGVGLLLAFVLFVLDRFIINNDEYM